MWDVLFHKFLALIYQQNLILVDVKQFVIFVLISEFFFCCRNVYCICLWDATQFQRDTV